MYLPNFAQFLVIVQVMTLLRCVYGFFIYLSYYCWMLTIMTEFWDKVYSSEESFFGDIPRHFTLISYNDFKNQGVKKFLELGCGQGRDTIFFCFQ